MNYPNQCYLELTQRCNLKCLHCFANGSWNQSSDMTLKQVKDIYHQLESLGVISVNISGGEPLLNRDFFSIMEFASQQPYTTHLLTNGTLWDEASINRLAEVDPHRNIIIQISLDGPSYAVMSKQRYITRSQYDQILKTIQRLQELGFSVTSLYVVSALTVAHTVETIHQAIFDLGISSMQVIPLFPAGRAALFRGELDDFWTDWSKLVVEVTKIKKYALWGKESFRFNMGFFNLYELVEPLDTSDMHDDICGVWGLDVSSKEAFLHQTRRDFYCESGRSELAISSDLQLFPCVASLRTSFKAGNLQEHTLQELWDKSEVLNWYRTELPRVIEREPCSSCTYKEICGGGCRISAQELCGDRYQPDPRCPKVRKFMERKVSYA